MARLHERKVNCLLVLDKCEELLADEETEYEWLTLLNGLAEASPNMKLLLTSQVDIQLEQTAKSIRLEQLSMPAAVAMLRSAKRGLTVDIAEKLATLCGCFPLALRVVERTLANPKSMVTPAQLLHKLNNEAVRVCAAC